MKTKGQGGRPQKALIDRKRPCTFSATTAELAAIDTRAKAAGIPRSRYLVSAALGHKISPAIPQINVQQWAALAPLASNLNQLARAANGGDLPGLVGIEEDLRGTFKLLSEIRRAIVGDAPDAR